MSKREMDEMGTTGYFLPEDSQFRLKKLHGHMVFLSQLAQPRTYDEEETGFGPEISGDELAVCLELLAEQAERVLDEVTWPAARKAVAQRSQARDEDEVEDAAADEVEGGDMQDDADADEAIAAEESEAEAEDAEDAEDAEHGTDAPQPLRFGMTLDQLDALNRMHDRLHAYGDLVFGAEQAELADGTLTTLGDVIFREAEAASDLMDQVASQSLPDPRCDKPRVREAHAAYGAPDSPCGASEFDMPMLPPHPPTGWATAAVTLH